MGEIKRFKPRDAGTAIEFLEEFIKSFGEQVEGVMVIAVAKDGEVIDGWTQECQDKVHLYLGALEQFKLDFWNTLFQKRADFS